MKDWEIIKLQKMEEENEMDEYARENGFENMDEMDAEWQKTLAAAYEEESKK